MNQLDSLKKFSEIAADTGDIDIIRFYNIQNATTNPSLILRSPLFTTYSKIFENSLAYARKKGGTKDTQITNASDKLIVDIGTEILKNISGNISTEIDARLSFDSNLTIKKAHKLIAMYQENHADLSRILIKIAATWEGIKAAEELERSKIKCNLTLVFSFAQALACAESNVYLISPFIGRIYDWYHQHNLLKKYSTDIDPGIQALKKIFNYYKTNNYSTIIMGASFRTIDQILAISGCDYLTISPNLLEQLSKNNAPVKRCLFPPKNTIPNISNPISKSDFIVEHNKNKMASDKLKEGIHLFSMDQQRLNDIITKQL